MSRWGIVCASGSDQNSSLNPTGTEREKSGVAFNTFGGVESFHGKSGSISFHGLTHQLVEESKLMSAPFQEEKGSFLWVLAPIALISSLILPLFFFSYAIEAFFKDETLVGLGGYLSSSFFTTDFKVVTPLFVVFVTWPVLGFQALVAVTPFLAGCAAQVASEKCRSSCWPLVPIIFENFMFSMIDSPRTPVMSELGSAFLRMVITFQVLAVVCLWSLMTFLQRLFPSRPVAENY